MNSKQIKKNYRSKQELSQMISTIRTDNYSWERIIQKGRVALRKIASVQLNMAANEDLWHIESRSKKLLVLEQRFSALTQRLENLYASMDQYLQDLSKIRDNTHRMLSQTSILKDDEILAQHKIAGKLSITQLTEFLDFLYHRYDAEWEVKDMVAREIQNSRDSSDIAFLVTTWNNCPHAGGTEFIEKFNLFYKRMGRRFV